MLEKTLSNAYRTKPIIHNITNYVTANDCANILLGVNASPIMADEISEVEEITMIANGLNLNLGTLNQRTIKAMFLAGEKSKALNHPIVLDLVGVGATTLRTETAKQLINQLDVTVVKGNLTEVKALLNIKVISRGVDTNENDSLNNTNLKETITLLQEVAKQMAVIIVVTGKIDLVVSSQKAYIIRNGHELMSSITGTGCMLSALITAFVCTNEDKLLACIGAVIAMGIAGEIAAKRMTRNDGNLSYRNYLLDAVSNLKGDELDRDGKYEIFKG